MPKKNAIFLAKFCLEEKKGKDSSSSQFEPNLNQHFFFFFAIKNYATIWLKNAYQMRMLRALINTGNKDYIELGLKSLIPNRNGFNRP